MAKQINCGVGGVVKKVKEVPLGIGGVVKKAKKGVCGAGGVVKEFFSSDPVIFDNGSTDFTWINATISDGYLTIGTSYELADYACYINKAIDISKYTKFKITFVDSTDSVTNSKTNGIVYLFDAGHNSSSWGNGEVGWNRSAGATFTLSLNLSDLTGTYDLSSFAVGVMLAPFNSDWYRTGHFSNQPKIKKIWFE